MRYYIYLHKNPCSWIHTPNSDCFCRPLRVQQNITAMKGHTLLSDTSPQGPNLQNAIKCWLMTISANWPKLENVNKCSMHSNNVEKKRFQNMKQLDILSKVKESLSLGKTVSKPLRDNQVGIIEPMNGFDGWNSPRPV